MMQMTAQELAHYKIRVNAVCPDRIETAIPENRERWEDEVVQVRAEYPAAETPPRGDKAERPRTWRDSCSSLSAIAPGVSLVRRTQSIVDTQ